MVPCLGSGYFLVGYCLEITVTREIWFLLVLKNRSAEEMSSFDLEGYHGRGRWKNQDPAKIKLLR